LIFSRQKIKYKYIVDNNCCCMHRLACITLLLQPIGELGIKSAFNNTNDNLSARRMWDQKISLGLHFNLYDVFTPPPSIHPSTLTTL